VDIRRGVPPATRGAITENPWDPYWDLIEECWDWNPESRPSAAAIFRSLLTKEFPCEPSLPDDFSADISGDTTASSPSQDGQKEGLSTATGEETEAAKPPENNEGPSVAVALTDTEPHVQCRADAQQDCVYPI
jgi:hypothetical protein